MHFVVSWQIKGPITGHSKIRERLRKCLKGYSWVRPFPNVYIIKVASAIGWETIIDRLKDVAKSTKMVNFIASPLMEGSSYRGWLPREMWEKIAKRAK